MADSEIVRLTECYLACLHRAAQGSLTAAEHKALEAATSVIVHVAQSFCARQPPAGQAH